MGSVIDRLFVRRQCGRCRRPILYNEFVVQTNEHVYHNHCFTCVLCQHRFAPGQHFAVADDGNVYCPSDFQLSGQLPAAGVPTRDLVVPTRDQVPIAAVGDRREPLAAADVPLCRSPLPNGADTVVSGPIWSELPWQQLETPGRSSADTFSPVTGTAYNASQLVSMSTYLGLLLRLCIYREWSTAMSV